MTLTSSYYSNLSHYHRERTPLRFAEYLVSKVKAIHHVDTVAVLWVQKRSVYLLIDGTDTWDVDRDARRYEGPYPIIAHPPCGPWGTMAHWNKHHSKEDGLIALELVHRYGGVVEHPWRSKLFRESGLTGRFEQHDQGDYGFSSPKPTTLYWVDTAHTLSNG